MTDVERNLSPTTAAAAKDKESHATTSSSDNTTNLANDVDTRSQRQDSLLKRLKSVREENYSDEAKDCLDKIFAICCGSAAEFTLLVISSGILIAMVSIGSVYLNDCPAERFIPIYLIVGGCFGLLQNIFSSILKILRVLQRNDNLSSIPGNWLLYLFLFSWYIAGSVWVYQTYGQFRTTPAAATDPTSDYGEHHDDYCHPVVFWFAFAIITAGYAFAAFIVVAWIFALCYVQCS